MNFTLVTTAWKSVEAKARERGLAVITPEFMEELRKASFGNEKPVFKF